MRRLVSQVPTTRHPQATTSQASSKGDRGIASLPAICAERSVLPIGMGEASEDRSQPHPALVCRPDKGKREYDYKSHTKCKCISSEIRERCDISDT